MTKADVAHIEGLDCDAPHTASKQKRKGPGMRTVACCLQPASAPDLGRGASRATCLSREYEYDEFTKTTYTFSRDREPDQWSA
jgi:hypothetical protein